MDTVNVSMRKQSQQDENVSSRSCTNGFSMNDEETPTPQGSL